MDKEFLVCNECGYKQYDDDTCKQYGNRHIYFCGACQDSADDETFATMQELMKKREENNHA